MFFLANKLSFSLKLCVYSCRCGWVLRWWCAAGGPAR